MPLFVFSYFMQGEPEQIAEVAPEHAAYWQDVGVKSLMGGPYADRTGGMVIFEAASLQKASILTDGDPFVQHGLLSGRWVKEWVLELVDKKN